MIATAAMLAALEPGELLVKTLRDGWTIPRDYAAIAHANRTAAQREPGTYRGRAPNYSQTECLEGAP